MEILILHSCRGAVVSPREQQVDIYITWIQQMRRDIAARGQSTDPANNQREIKEHEVTILIIAISFLDKTEQQSFIIPLNFLT